LIFLMATRSPASARPRELSRGAGRGKVLCYAPVLVSIALHTTP
jgi:hypothetical protein